LKEQALITGLMVSATKANGKIARCKALENYRGQMESNMLASLAMISSKARANISSTMEKFMSEDGMKESSMARGNLSQETKSR
jgi:hypothetical protein